MGKIAQRITGAGALGLLAACASTPLGPSVSVYPAPFKPFEVFEREQDECVAYAEQRVSGQADAANRRALGATALGAVIGLGLGAATGDGNAATVGGVAGTAIGGSIGSDQSQRAEFSIQRRYDIAYTQCMYAKGNQVPGFRRAAAPPPPPPGAPPPPPPPGSPPPPPPRS